MGEDRHSYGRDAYLRLMAARPELFENAADGGIEILTSPEDMDRAENAARDNWARMGYSGDDFRCGVLSSDPFVTLVRDAVRFPNGTLGLHNRLLEGWSVAVLPVWQGAFQLIRIYRHGLRQWFWEFPRGGVNPGEALEDAARRELNEEMGAEVRALTDLGPFTPGGSVLAVRARLFRAELSALGEPAHDEGIAEIASYKPQKVADMIASGEIIDGFTIALFARHMALEWST